MTLLTSSPVSPADKDSSVDLIYGDLKELDVGLALIVNREDDKVPLSLDESKRILRKVDMHVLPLLCLVFVQWIDKNTLSASSILGLISDAHLSTKEFNTLASAFFIGYLVFQWPQNWALQRLPVGKWLTFNIFLWSVLLGMHSVCHNFASLFVLRFLLGAAEGCTNSAMMIICSMFYTRKEVSERIGYTFQCNGVAMILSGFLQFGLAHVSPGKRIDQWQWMMIVTSLFTLVTSILFLLHFPDNPLNARFLTPEERVKAVRRVRENQNGIETKVWKKYQFVEAMKDPKIWLYLAFMSFALLEGGVSVQYSLLIKSFGFTQMQTTLLNIPGGFCQIIFIIIASYAVRRFPNSRGWISIISWTPCIIGCFIGIFLPLENRIGHLVGVYCMYMGVQPAVIITMSWVVSNTSGHTKKLTATAFSLIGFSLGNALGTQFWLDKYKPSNRVPWCLVLMANVMAILCTLALRFLFARENKRRDAMKADAIRRGVGLAAFEEYSVVETVDIDGQGERKRIDRMYLDLTDGENLAFRYVL